MTTTTGKPPPIIPSLTSNCKLFVENLRATADQLPPNTIINVNGVSGYTDVILVNVLGLGRYYHAEESFLVNIFIEADLDPVKHALITPGILKELGLLGGQVKNCVIFGKKIEKPRLPAIASEFTEKIGWGCLPKCYQRVDTKPRQ
jgi:hypothetical protein